MAPAHRLALIAGALACAAVAYATESQWLPEIVNEGSTTKVTLTVTDLNGLPPPTTTPGVTSIKDVRVWVIDAETGVALATPAPVTPGVSVDVTVGSGSNRVVSTTKDTEEHIVTGAWAYGASCTPTTLANCTVGTSEAHFLVRSLKGVSVGAGTGPTPLFATPTATP